MLMKQLSPEEHILASINLYLDIVNLFLHILRVLDSMKKHWVLQTHNLPVLWLIYACECWCWCTKNPIIDLCNC